MRAGIYTRVSTDNQEAEGTSLQTQLEACLNYCRDKGYKVAYRFNEAYSGLTLERPKLNELRELIRAGGIDVIVVYCLDRLSRDPVHGVILTQELERHSVGLEAVTETVDSSEVGKLINYIKGFASKLEAEKIKERTTRGRKAKAKQGQIPGGGFARTYGYDYVKAHDKQSGKRIINESEAKWVCQIYRWLTDDGISTTAITNRLRALNIPTKHGGIWLRQTVLGILKNPAYTGKTYAFTTADGKRFRRPQEEWVEIPDVTPPIISQEIFEAAQKQLQLNRQKATRNMKREYLLHGHIYCRKCRRPYWGWLTTTASARGKRYEWRRYRCSGSVKMVAPVNRCYNKSWNANKLEALVWAQIERVLNNPELIITQIEKQREDANEPGVLESELQQIERHLKTLDRDQEQLLQWALKGFPEQTVVAENKRINEKKTSLELQKAELGTQIKASREAAVSLPKLERFVELMQQKLSTQDYETKRLALEMLNIKVWIDGHNVEITGVLPVTDDAIVTMQSG